MFRTVVNNNPTAFTTDVAKDGGLTLNADYVQGTPFEAGDETYYTAKLIGDPAAVTTKLLGGQVIDAEPGTPGLKIGLVSMTVNSLDFNGGHDHGSIGGHLDIFFDVVNAHEDLDIIVFPGWTLLAEDLALVKRRIKNKKSLVLFEVWDPRMRKQLGCFIKEGTLQPDKGIIQQFAESRNDVDKVKLKKVFDQLRNERVLGYKGKNICWLMCGEINVMRNIQNNHNRVEFRLPDDRDLRETFKEICDATDIFINPTHTIMGNQGKLAQRRKFLSQRNKVFCSVSNADTAVLRKMAQKLTGKAAQYVYKDGREISGKLLPESNDRFVLKEYDV